MTYIPFFLKEIVYGEQHIDLFGSQIVVGDVDGDGLNEIIISAPTSLNFQNPDGVNPRVLYNSGRVYVYNNNMEYQYHLCGSDEHIHFGHCLALGDVNGDGLVEIIISAPFEGNENGVQCGAVHIYSGLTKQKLYSLYGKSPFQRMGSTLTVTDINKDGYDDIIVSSALLDQDGFRGTGRVDVFSGKDKQPLYSLTTTDREQLGYALAAADLNQDGVVELAIGAPEASTEKEKCGKVYFFSGDDGHLLNVLEGQKGERMGTSLAVGDINGDHHLELVIGSCFSSSNGLVKNGRISVYSPQADRLLYHIDGSAHHEQLGRQVVLYDLEGDGAQELLISSRAGTVTILEGKTKQIIKKIYGEAHTLFGAHLAIGNIAAEDQTELLVGALTCLHHQLLRGAVYRFTAQNKK